jgi:hypothetical protein
MVDLDLTAWIIVGGVNTTPGKGRGMGHASQYVWVITDAR